jgi:cobalt-precorrin 5A hydrolase
MESFMNVAVITLSLEGCVLAERLVAHMPGAELYLHQDVVRETSAHRFPGIVALTRDIFTEYRGLVYIAPCGVVVRSLDGLLDHKTRDPAVVVVDVGARWAVSLLSGHEGGANDLALRVANILNADAVVSTTTEAIKTLIVGVGCRKGVEASAIEAAIRNTLDGAGLDIALVRLLASADVKASEPGLLEAAELMGLPIRFLSSDQIRNTAREFASSSFVQEKVQIPAVAEPCALLAGTRTRLVVPRQAHDGITVAVAEEAMLWKEPA